MPDDDRLDRIVGRGCALRGHDIDTDRIIPARFLRCVTFDGLGEHAFKDDREHAKGDHPLDAEHFEGANILIVGHNFGCGSSREHAPQALARFGFDAFVGLSFAEIFFGNCVALGLPCVTLAESDHARLRDAVQADPQQALVVDLVEDGTPVGRSYRQAPETDGVLLLDRGTPGEWLRARVTASYGSDLSAEVVE